jgi:minor tail protein
MSNPTTVTATISANDLASPKVRELMATLKQAQKLANEAFNGNSTGKYAAGLNNATSAAKNHLGVLHQIHAAHKAIAATAVGYAGTKIVHGSLDAIKNSLPYLREDRAMQARTGYTDNEMRDLRRQQGQLAGRYGSKIEDTLKAQETFGRLQYNAKTNVAMVGPTAVGARAMGVSTDKVAELMEAMISQTGMTFKSPEDAAVATRHLNDLAATATKKSNMTFEDVQGFESYSAAAANSAGLSPEQNLAMGMALRRGGIVGSEAGVFSRQFSARVMAPTRKGREMLAQHGINIDEFASHGIISGEGLSDKLARNFGKGLSKGAIDKLNKDLEENGGEILGSRAAYSKAVMNAVQSSGEKLSKTDQKHVTASANEYYDFSKSGFRGGALLEAMLNSGDPMVMQGFLGDKQGARANALLTEKDKYYEAKNHLQGSDGFSQQVADKMNEGLAAAVDKLTASFDALEKGLVKANEAFLTPIVDGATKVVSMFNNLSDEGKQAVGVLAGIGTLAAGGATVYAFASFLKNVNTLATAAGNAANALNVIAEKGALPGGVPGAPGAKPGSTGAKWTRRGLGAAGAAATIFGGPGMQTGGVLASMFGPEFIPLGAAAGAAYDNWPAIKDWATNDDIATGSAEDTERRRRFALGPATWGRSPPSYDRITLGPDSSRALRGADIGTSGGWQDSINPGSKSDGVKDVSVTGTVSGSAEIHQMIEVRPSAYLESVVKRAESVSTMGLNGKLGTSMGGPGDNSVKPSIPATVGSPAFGGT